MNLPPKQQQQQHHVRFVDASPTIILLDCSSSNNQHNINNGIIDLDNYDIHNDEPSSNGTSNNSNSLAVATKATTATTSRWWTKEEMDRIQRHAKEDVRQCPPIFALCLQQACSRLRTNLPTNKNMTATTTTTKKVSHTLSMQQQSHADVGVHDSFETATSAAPTDDGYSDSDTNHHHDDCNPATGGSDPVVMEGLDRNLNLWCRYNPTCRGLERMSSTLLRHSAKKRRIALMSKIVRKQNVQRRHSTNNCSSSSTFHEDGTVVDTLSETTNPEPFQQQPQKQNHHHQQLHHHHQHLAYDDDVAERMRRISEHISGPAKLLARRMAMADALAAWQQLDYEEQEKDEADDVHDNNNITSKIPNITWKQQEEDSTLSSSSSSLSSSSSSATPSRSMVKQQQQRGIQRELSGLFAAAFATCSVHDQNKMTKSTHGQQPDDDVNDDDAHHDETKGCRYKDKDTTEYYKNEYARRDSVIRFLAHQESMMHVWTSTLDSSSTTSP